MKLLKNIFEMLVLIVVILAVFIPYTVEALNHDGWRRKFVRY